MGRTHILLEKHQLKEALELADRPGVRVLASQAHWGAHLIVDGSEANTNINDPDVIRSFLLDLMERLDLKPLSDPFVAYSHDEEGRGYSGIILITTSHISIHCDDTRNAVYFDCFICKEYNKQVALGALNEYFAPKKMRHLWIYRDAGDYPMPKEQEKWM